MAGKKTSKLVALYISMAAPTLFLAGFFRTPLQNYHKSEKVEIDIMRSEEDVAIVVTNLSTGARENEDDLYTNKEFTPPIFDEEGALNSFDLMARQPGATPYDDPNFQAAAVSKAYRLFRKLEDKIRRSIEMMASQVLQTATLTLRDKAGTPLYQVNFAPKAAHFPDAGVAWDEAGAEPLNDLNALAEVIRTNGKVDCDTLIFGDLSFSWFLANDEVKERLNSRRGVLAEVNPVSRGQGATFQGYIWVGNYRFAMWTYNGRYRDPQTGASTRYIAQNSVVMMSSTGTILDLTFGAIPTIVPPDSRVLPFLPPRIENTEGGMDLSTYAWVSGDGKNLKVSAGTRPMTIPTGIDTFGCLDTLVTEE